MSSNKLKQALISGIIRGYRFFTSNRIRQHNEYKPLEVRKIVIFSTTALGDFMFNTPSIESLWKSYPGTEFTLVSSHKNQTLVEDSKWFSEVIYWDQKINTLLGVAKYLRAIKPDVIVILHSKSPYDILCATLSNTRFIFKDAYNEHDLAMRKWVTSVSEPNFDGHIIERKLSLVKSMGGTINNIQMKLPCTPRKINRSQDKIVIGFQLGASERLRQWPVTFFRRLAQLLLLRDDKYEVALIGSPNERALSDQFFEGLTENEQCRIKDYIGRSSLKQLVERISEFDLLITGDTGPLHLAVALRIKTVSLFVTANPAHTGPLQDPSFHTIIRGCPVEAELLDDFPEEPMAIIQPETVLAAILNIFE